MAAASSLVGYTNPLPKPGEPGYTPSPQHHLRVMFENDSAAGADANYSHGTRIDYAQNFAGNQAWGISLTQNIYTPESHASHAIPGQHPYAGYMALGGAYLIQGEDIASTFELQVGTTGNPSLSRYMQNGLHEACGMDTWDGWSYQVPAEVTFQFSSRQDIRIPWMESSMGRWQTDAALYLKEEVGSVRISGGAGFSARIGHNLPPTMRMTGNHAANYGAPTLLSPDYKPEEASYFLVGNIECAYVARDITIDGGVFHHFDQTCSRVPWQMEARLGLGVSYQGIDYFMGGVYHTDTYRTQEEDSFYGCFAISFHW